MKNLLYAAILIVALGCQSESLDIQANYRIRLLAKPSATTIKLRQGIALPMELLTDSYYSESSYQLQFYQQNGLGRLSRLVAEEAKPVLQKVPVGLPLGPSLWQYTPEALGSSQIVLIAQQERGYTQPDTIRINFQVVP
jgi:hypothetical protein